MLQKSDKPRGKFQSYVLTEVVYVSDATDVSADMEINKSEEKLSRIHERWTGSMRKGMETGKQTTQWGKTCSQMSYTRSGKS